MNSKNQRLIGLTGGIATGKTTVSNYLQEKYHLPILDADLYSREAVNKDSPILSAIFTRYGDRLKLADGNLDRPQLGQIIFNDSLEKRWLEGQIHPYVRDRFQKELRHMHGATIVLDIPLLFEADFTGIVTEIWVVSCDYLLQTTRLQKRNNLTLIQAQARISNQIPLKDKVAVADVVLNNNKDVAYLYAQVDKAMKLA